MLNIVEMSGQKNSGNKGRKRESGVSKRHNLLISNLMSDLKNEGKADGIYIGRVLRKLGNGRVEVFYVAKEIQQTFDKMGNEIEKEVPVSHEGQAIIKGSFRGRGKHSVWIDLGGIVIVSDTGLGILEIVGVLTQDQLNEIAKVSFIDERIMKPMVTGDSETNDALIEFGNESEDEKLSDNDINNI